MVQSDDTNTTTTDTPTDLNQWSKTKGYERFNRKRETSDIERLDVELRVIDAALDDAVAGWLEYRDELKAKMTTRGPKPKAAEEVLYLDPTAVCIAALSVMWEGVVPKLEHQKRLIRIGLRLEQQAFRQALHDHLSSTERNTIIKKASDRHGNVDQELSKKKREERQQQFFNPRFESMKMQARRKGLDWTDWSDETRANAGSHAHNVALKYTNLFVEDVEKRKKRGKYTDKHILLLTPEAEAERAAGVSNDQWMVPVFQVLTEKAIPWGSWMNAPYPNDDELCDLVPLVRKANKAQNAAIQEALINDEMPLVVEAVNALQDVGFCINQDVWEAVQWCVEEKLEPGDSFWKLKKLDFRKPAAVNDNGDDTNTDDELLTKIINGQIREHNRAVTSGVVMRGYIEDTVKMLKSSTFYVPMNLDFRSRIYPVPVFNHYGPDHIKALHYFAHAKPIGEKGLYWLFIHTATVGDFTRPDGRRISKLPLEDRIKWVSDNIEQLLAVGRDFRATYDYWSAADSPFSFLAACIELVRVEEHGLEFRSGLPVAIDGACSGYQHFSAAMRATKEARLVNLMPTDEPEDIYQYIADKVIAVVERDAAREPADADDIVPTVARLWLEHGITRKTVKRPVMTASYNSNAYGFTDQIMSDLMNPLFQEVLEQKRDRHPFAVDTDRNGFRAAQYLGRIVFDQITSNLQAATEGMEFFKAHVNACTAKGEHFRMRSPLNFPFFQGYTNTRRLKIFPSMWSRGVYRRVQVTLMAENDNEPPQGYKVEKVKDTPPVHRTNSENAISASVTHMADACHMQMTICAARREGITNFMMIHDSFGTAPADMPLMFDIVRDMFVALYEDYDPFQAVQEATDDIVNFDAKGQRIPPFVPSEDSMDVIPNPDYTVLPRCPDKGSLDLKKVADAMFCFI